MSSQKGWKTLWEKEKLLVMRNFFISHSGFKIFVLQTRKNSFVLQTRKNSFVLQTRKNSFALENVNPSPSNPKF